MGAGSRLFKQTVLVLVAFALFAFVLMSQYTASAHAEAVTLAWDANLEGDLAGYNVYRSEQSGLFPAAPLNGATFVTTSSFTDTTAQSNRIYYYVVTAVASSGEESAYSSEVQAVTGSADAANRPPAVNAGPDQTITLPATAALTAAAADDHLANDALSYQWSVVSGGGVFFRTPRSATTEVSFPAPGEYTLRVTVSDGVLASSDDLIVSVKKGLTWGHIEMRPGAGGPTPSGLAVIGHSKDGRLVSEAAFPASPPIRSGRVYTAIQGSVNTGIAISNPQAAPVTMDFYFTDATGGMIHYATTLIAGNGKLSAFLNEHPFAPPAHIQLSSARTFTFSASLPIAFTAVRAFINERSEFLMTPLPIAPLQSIATAPIAFPYYVDGGGWKTEIQLVNPTGSALSGLVHFLPSLSGSSSDPDFLYEIPPRSAITLRTMGLGLERRTGWVRVTPVAGTLGPSGSLVSSFRANGVTLFEAAIPGTRATSTFHVYAETAGSSLSEPGSIQTQVAVSNPNPTQARIDLELFALDGTRLEHRGSLTVPGNGLLTAALNQVPGLERLPTPFRGYLRLGGAPVVAVALKGRYSDRGDLLLTPMSAIAESPLTPPESVYVYFVDGGGYATQFIKFDSTTKIVQ